ncbi:MAG: ATP-binding protein, partial [Coraliomargarita sp.]
TPYLHQTWVLHLVFESKQGVVPLPCDPPPLGAVCGSVVQLNGFREKYRNSTRKTAEAIANQLFEHCLWYFIRDGGVPSILVRDGELTIDLDDVYESHMHSDASQETLEIKGHNFSITHIKLRTSNSQDHVIGWCAANRLVKEESIAGKLPGLYGRLGEEDQFIYACYVTSTYLDDRVRPERTDFVIESTPSSGLLADQEISQAELSDAVLVIVEKFLSEFLEQKKQKSINRVQQFVAERQPRYRPIISRIPEDALYVDPSISDKELDVFLHRHRYEVEGRMIAEGHEIMAPRDGEGVDDYKERVREYLELADDIKKSDLAEYVSHRKVILDLLKVATERNDTGGYVKEELIHELIMPLRARSDSISFSRNNLWLIDEKLAFHDFLASDVTLRSMPITDSEEGKEPDILALNVYDQPVLVTEERSPPLASIVVVELKRPMRKDAGPGEDHDPIEQSLGYLRRVRSGQVTTSSGRPIPNSTEIPGFCYVICDLTERMIARCEIHGLTVTSDHTGYFGYNSAIKAYIEVISFDRLLQSAYQRNRAFFDKLGLPSN